MKTEFIGRLYWALTDAECGMRVGSRLDELYTQDEVCKKALDSLMKHLYETDLTIEVNDLLESCIYSAVWAFEKQGFINGFRLGMQLAQEVAPDYIPQEHGKNEAHKDRL